MSIVLYPDNKLPVHLAGGKASTLSNLKRAHLLSPDWFVTTPEAFEQCLSDAHKKDLSRSYVSSTEQFSLDMGTLIDSIELKPEVSGKIMQALNKLGPDSAMFAVRSSAIDEDSSRFSFAGQLESYLFVPKEEVLRKVKQVWKSGFNEQVLSYRKEAGLDIDLKAPAVLVQRMVNADVSGVAFAADPVTGDKDVCVIAAVYGLGTGLVSGEFDADTYHVDQRGQVIKRELVEKNMAHRMDLSGEEGVSSSQVDQVKAKQAALTHDQAAEIAELTRRASDFVGSPQDIEWAIENNILYLLQSRAITALKHLADPAGELIIWDNSNLIESYGGMTTPLTFSLARKAYQEVYRGVCRIFRVPSTIINQNDTTFKRMLGLIRGRVYYNMASCSRVLAMLPGFAMNRKWMAKMMGFREGMADMAKPPLQKPGLLEKIIDALRFANTTIRLELNHWLLPLKLKRFYKRLNTSLSKPEQALKAMRVDELIAYYHQLENQLLSRWDAGLINDFFAMRFYDLLSERCKKWLGDKHGTLKNSLLCDAGGMISAEPAKSVRAMAEIVVTIDSAKEVFINGSLREIEKWVAMHPALEKAYRDYLQQFGDRCLDELKLESETLHDNPILLFRSIGQLAHRLSGEVVAPYGDVGASIRATAERGVNRALAGKRIKRFRFYRILSKVRQRVRDRENLRFERTRLFARVRRIFVEIGERFTEANILDKQGDIFYLETNEISAYIQGTSTSMRLKELVAIRRAEFKSYQSMDVPADRFETRGLVYLGNDFKSLQHAVIPGSDTDSLQGLGCCPGTVKAKVRVIKDPKHANLKSGEILVAERTDPGWIMLFPAASAILVERGSLLSHSAIVAREMGIPAVVSVNGLMHWLKDGDTVEVDGSTGRINRISKSI